MKFAVMVRKTMNGDFDLHRIFDSYGEAHNEESKIEGRYFGTMVQHMKLKTSRKKVGDYDSGNTLGNG